MRKIIAVVGSDRHATKKQERIAEQIGKEIANKNAVVLCGGVNRGVMQAVAKGASINGGIVIGILPGSDLSEASKYIIPILTGLGFARNQILAFSCNAMIVIGGGVGALSEVAYAYAYGKPIIYVKGSQGLLKKFVGKYMDKKRTVKILEASPKKAVELALKLAK